MRILTVPNWSFGRDAEILGRFEEILRGGNVFLHYLGADVDHNRTVTAFSGTCDAVEETLFQLSQFAFGRLDMRTHVGVHPRIGAMDVCPFIPLEAGIGPLTEAKEFAERVGARLADVYGVPVYLYERSERGRHEADLPALRRGGFEALAGRELRPDFGPAMVHPRLGVTVLGVRDFLIAFNVNLDTDDLTVARDLAREIRVYRADGDPRFLGVRALGFPLRSKGLTQVSMNLTLPDVTPVDPIVGWIEAQATELGVDVDSTELIGVIRDRDVLQATELFIRPNQVVTTSHSL